MIRSPDSQARGQRVWTPDGKLPPLNRLSPREDAGRSWCLPDAGSQHPAPSGVPTLRSLASLLWECVPRNRVIITREF